MVVVLFMVLIVLPWDIDLLPTTDQIPRLIGLCSCLSSISWPGATRSRGVSLCSIFTKLELNSAATGFLFLLWPRYLCLNLWTVMVLSFKISLMGV
jgi:hypothetical protein